MAFKFNDSIEQDNMIYSVIKKYLKTIIFFISLNKYFKSLRFVAPDESINFFFTK